MTAHTCSITCTNPACVKRRIQDHLSERFFGYYTKERAIELVAREWYSDKARIIELMAKNKKLQARIDFLEREEEQ